VDAPKDCGKALLYYSPVAERVVSSAQRLRGGKLLEKVASPAAPLSAARRRRLLAASRAAVRAVVNRSASRSTRLWAAAAREAQTTT